MPTWLLDGSAAITGKAWAPDMTAVLPGPGLLPALAGQRAAGWRPLDSTTIIGPTADDGPGHPPISIGTIDLRQPDRRAPALMRDAAGTWVPAVDVRCHELAAGGGEWLARGDHGHCYGTWANKDGIGRFVVSADGELICCPTSANVGLECYRAGASAFAWSLHTTTIKGLALSGRTLLICEDAPEWRVVSLDDGRTIFRVPRVFDGLPAELAGEHLVWSSDRGLAIRRRDSTRGWIVSAGADEWRDPFARADGLIAITSSRQPDDAPGAIQFYEVDPVAGQVRAPGGAWTPMAPADFSLPPLGDVVRLDREALIGWFDFDRSAGQGNVSLPIRQLQTDLRSHPCVIASAAVKDQNLHLLGPDQEIYALWAGEGHPDDGPTEAIIDRVRPIADALGVGLLVYQDDRGPWRPGVLARLQPGDLLAPQLFINLDEPVARFAAYAELRAVEGAWPIVPVVSAHRGQAATHAGRTDAQLAGVAIVASRLARDYGWHGVLLFRRGLADGPSSAVQPYWDALIAGVTGRPAPPDPDASDPEPPAPSTPHPPVPTPALPPVTPFPILETPMYALRDLLTPSAFNGVAAPFLSYNPVTEKFGYRPWAEAWEQFEVSQEGHDLLVRIVDADRQYAITEDGRDETRDVGTDGPFERSQGGRLPDGRLVVVHFNSAGRIVRAFEAIPFDSAPKKSDFPGVAA